ncbi:DUF2510 domain-containing protein [Glaciibacter psychrotolerans]|uniref:DUF2510 domain-containing protein n=2 Tax=Glaciibacter psychrotolerans TaxID=670054 RepID=A0A7Z0J673_9MICO|nr:DUF2510 domain-containing protein [Leifsonia psychrotolerans]NYJ19926.1 hypothetical protein [Leifsonia psychrotolerans]
MADQTPFVPPAGWYVDPTTETTLRWWNGLAWTDHVSALPELVPAPRIAPVSQYSWEREEDKTHRVQHWGIAAEAHAEYTAIPSRWGTLSVWLIAFTPWWEVGCAVIVATVLENVWLECGALILPWLLTIVWAQRDGARLRAWGHRNVPRWPWALLGAPGYLIARTVVLRRNTGIGSPPLWVWIANLLIVGGLIALGVLLFLSALAGLNHGY